MRLSQSMLQTFDDCLRKGLWAYGPRPLEPARPSIFLDEGKWVHAGLAGWYKAGQEAMWAAYELAVQGTRAKRFSAARGAGSLPPEGDEAIFAEAEAEGRRLLAAYVGYYPTEAWQVAAVPESPVLVPLGGRHELLVVLDLLVEQDGALWVVDHKTARATGDSYWRPYFVDLQATAYCWAVERWLGRPVAGFIVNVLKKTKVPTFERRRFMRLAADLEAFEVQARVKGDAIAARTEAWARAAQPPGRVLYSSKILNELAPQNTGACNARHWVCPFLGLCEAGGELAVVEAQYRERVHD